MHKKLIIAFLLITCSIFSVPQFGKAFGDNRDSFFSPTITKKYGDEYYLADYFSGDIMVYDKDFKLKRVYTGISKLNDLNKIGNELFITLGDKNQVKIINLLTNKVSYFGQKGIRRVEFVNPGEIEKDEKYIYIVDEHNSRIQIFDYNKNFVQEVAFPKSIKTKVSFSLNYSVKKQGDSLFVLDKGNKLIYKYTNLKLSSTVDLKNFLEPYKLYLINKKIYVYEKIKNEFVDINTNIKAKLDLERDVTLVDIRSFGEGPMGVYLTQNSKLYYFSLIAEKSKELKTILPLEKGNYVKPLEIKKDLANNVYILDGVLNEILIYNSKGLFIKKISNLPQDSYSFDIDINGDFIILSNKTNSLYRISSSGKVIDYIENDNRVLAYEPYYYKDKNKKGIIDNILYYNKIYVDRNRNVIYLTDNKNKKIKVMNARFSVLRELGKKEGVLNTVSKKISSDTFSFNEFDRTSLTDISVNGDIYVVDAPYKRVVQFSSDGFVKTLSNEKFTNGISSISFYNNKILFVDRNQYKLYVFSRDMKLQKEVNLAKLGFRPLEIRGNLLIATTYVKEFNEKYVILDVSSLI